MSSVTDISPSSSEITSTEIAASNGKVSVAHLTIGQVTYAVRDLFVTPLGVTARDDRPAVWTWMAYYDHPLRPHVSIEGGKFNSPHEALLNVEAHGIHPSDAWRKDNRHLFQTQREIAQ